MKPEVLVTPFFSWGEGTSFLTREFDFRLAQNGHLMLAIRFIGPYGTRFIDLT